MMLSLGRVLTGIVLMLAGVVHAADPPEANAQALRARHAALQERLAHNEFQRPLVLQSEQTSGDLKGDVYAVVDQGFSRVQQLSQADHWCEVLILHLNVKHCAASGAEGARKLAVTLGKKVDQDLDDAYRVDFDYQLAAAGAEYLQVLLHADEGPLGTSDYRITLEALPLDATHSFLHMTYSYAYGLAARIAMKGYLSTIGAGKVGFSIVGKTADGQPRYVDNVRGVVERNTMRYYLAIEAYLDSLAVPEAERSEKRLEDWFAATERYPLQLHELDRKDYIEMKHRELQRQREGTLPEKK